MRSERREGEGKLGTELTNETLGKAQAMFYGTCSVAEENEGRLEPSWRTIQVTMYAKIGDFGSREAATKCVVEGEEGGNEGWTLFTGNLQTDVYRF